MATALVAARLLGRPRSAAIQAAHLADFFGRGGLGGVAAILGGGLEIRIRPGIPPFGRIEHHRLSGSVLVGTVGETLPSPSILSRPRLLQRIRRSAGEVDQLSARPTLEEFFRLSERFTDRVRLASPRLRAVIRSLRRRDTWAAQAMFGESFLALPRTRAARRAVVDWLLDRDIAAVELRPARRGAFAAPGSVEMAS
jgi:pantoate kinase